MQLPGLIQQKFGLNLVENDKEAQWKVDWKQKTSTSNSQTRAAELLSRLKVVEPEQLSGGN
jgi:hypothetical protein